MPCEWRSHAACVPLLAALGDGVSDSSLDRTRICQTIDHPLWSAAVTWQGAHLAHRPFYEALESTTLGEGLSVFLPKAYVECDTWQDRLNARRASPAGEAEAGEIYSRFSNLVSDQLLPPTDADIQRYDRYLRVTISDVGPA